MLCYFGFRLANVSNRSVRLFADRSAEFDSNVLDYRANVSLCVDEARDRHVPFVGPIFNFNLLADVDAVTRPIVSLIRVADHCSLAAKVDC